MSHNAIGLLKANGQIEEYGNTSGGTGSVNFVGTTEEWNALSAAEKAEFDSSKGVTVNLSDDNEGMEIVDISSNITFHSSLSNTVVNCYKYGKVVNFNIYFHVTTAISGVWQNLVDGFPTALAQLNMVNVSNMVNERTTINSIFSLSRNSNHIENGKPLSAGDDVWLSGTYLTND